MKDHPGTAGFQSAPAPTHAAKDGGAPSNTPPGTAGFQPATPPPQAARDGGAPRRSPALQSHWHSRGYLPHFEKPDSIQHITFRLADSIPRKLIHSWRAQLQATVTDHDSNAADVALRQKIEAYLDDGHGQAFLKRAKLARIVQDVLLHGHGSTYLLHAWCIMPNHVHELVEITSDARTRPISKIVHSWKSYTASKANKLLGRTGSFWMREYHDRYIRNATHYKACVEYIHENPVKAGLVSNANHWPWSSASAPAARDGGDPSNTPPGTAGFQPATAPTHAARDGGAPSSNPLQF